MDLSNLVEQNDGRPDFVCTTSRPFGTRGDIEIVAFLIRQKRITIGFVHVPSCSRLSARWPRSQKTSGFDRKTVSRVQCVVFTIALVPRFFPAIIFGVFRVERVFECT